MKTFFLLSISACVLLLFSCKKDTDERPHITCNAAGDGSVTAVINNTAWSGCALRGEYDPHPHLLFINAIDSRSNYELRIFIALDSLHPLKTYALGPDRNCGIEVIEGLYTAHSSASVDYFDDLSNPGLGGSFTLTSLDTITGRVSANFNVTGYSPDQLTNITVTNGVIDNVACTVNSTLNMKSYISATVNGTEWSGKFINAFVDAYGGTTASSYMQIESAGYVDGYGFLGDSWNIGPGNGDERSLRFNVPLGLTPGSYQLYPFKYPNVFGFSSPRNVFAYNLRNYDNQYYPDNSAVMTVVNVDPVNRNYDALFTAHVTDSLGHTVNFTNGKIHVVNWQPFCSLSV